MDRLTELSENVETLFASPLHDTRTLHGGDLSEVRLLTLANGRKMVVKSGPLVAREARMLRTIAEAGAPSPEILGQSGDYLFLEALTETSPTFGGWQQLGKNLAALHRFSGTHYGWQEEYAFGAVSILNTAAPNWPVFWAERRLLPFVAFLPVELARRLEALALDLPDLLPSTPRAVLLHGDLWTGNVLFGPNGSAHMIDPACYFGHAEVDLAMLSLFGQPGAGFAEAYGPHTPGHAERRAVYQLWPALVHFRLFGAGYLPMVEQRLAWCGH